MTTNTDLRTVVRVRAAVKAWPLRSAFTAGDIAERAGIDRKLANYHLHRLAIEGAVRKVTKGAEVTWLRRK